MSENRLQRPLVLAGVALVSAMIGGGVVAGLDSARPPAAAGEAIRAYLLSHPEVLPEAMERLQAREAEKAERAQAQAQQSVPQHVEALGRPYAGAWSGNPKGDVTVVAFMDYACGYCRASLPGLDKLIASDPNVRVVYREYPVLGPDSVLAARWALAAAEQDRYRAFHDALYAAGSPSTATIAAAAQKAGLDLRRAEASVRSQAVAAEINQNHGLGEKLAMTGTPSWVIGGHLYYGARDYAALAAAVAQARARR